MSISSTGTSLRWDSMKAISDWASFRLDDQGLEARERFRGFDLLLQVVEGKTETVGDLRQQALNFVDVVAQEQDAEGRIIVHQHAPGAVEHGAARRDHRNGADAVPLGELRVAIGIDNLQPPKAEQQQSDQSDDDVGDDGQPRLRQATLSLKRARQRKLRAAPESLASRSSARKRDERPRTALPQIGACGGGFRSA